MPLGGEHALTYDSLFADDGCFPLRPARGLRGQRGVPVPSRPRRRPRASTLPVGRGDERLPLHPGVQRRLRQRRPDLLQQVPARVRTRPGQLQHGARYAVRSSALQRSTLRVACDSTLIQN